MGGKSQVGVEETKNKFLPSQELTNKFINAMTGSRKKGLIGNLIGNFLFRLRNIEAYATGGIKGTEPNKYIGERVIWLTSTLALRASYEGRILRIGENGRFSDEFSRMLEDRIPIERGNAYELYSALYQEFYQYVKNNECNMPWGRIVADETGILVTDISPIIQKHL